MLGKVLINPDRTLDARDEEEDPGEPMDERGKIDLSAGGADGVEEQKNQ